MQKQIFSYRIHWHGSLISWIDIRRYPDYMRPVAVIGIGKTAFGAFPDRDLRSLAVEAGQRAIQDAGVQPSQIEAFYLGNFAGPLFVGQNHLAPYIASAMGITGVPATRFEAACASSGSAFFHAVSAVAAGLHDIVLVGGVEKMTSQPTPRVAEILAAAGDVSGEVRAGATFPSLFAMIARRHMHQFGTTREHLAAVAVKNHANGAINPCAHMRKVITMEQAMTGKPDRRAADCLRLLADQRRRGGRDDRAARARRRVHRQAGAGAAASRRRRTTWRSIEKDDITTFPAVRARGEKAYKMAGRTAIGHPVRRTARLLHHRRDHRDRGPRVRGAGRGRTVQRSKAARCRAASGRSTPAAA